METIDAHHGHHGPDDVAAVRAAADLLRVSHLEVFRRAHAAWFAGEPETGAVADAFGRYLRSGATPPWVRHHARRVTGAGAGRRAAGPARCGPFTTLLGRALGALVPRAPGSLV